MPAELKKNIKIKFIPEIVIFCNVINNCVVDDDEYEYYQSDTRRAKGTSVEIDTHTQHKSDSDYIFNDGKRKLDAL